MTSVIIPKRIADTLRAHLFQGELEQGAFMFAQVSKNFRELKLAVEQIYLIPANGWEVQLDVYLQMKDTERARIMKMAKDNGLAIVDCHSHPGSGGNVSFSPSDKTGIADFAAYAKWKLGGRPYVATVWGESSIDAVIWQGAFQKAQKVSMFKITGRSTENLIPRGSWFRRPRPYWWSTYDK